MKSKFTASNTGIARIGTYDSFVEENDGKPVDIGYALNLITSDDLAFKAVAVVDKLPSPKDAAPGLFYQLDKDFYTLNSKEDGFDKVILGADTTLGLTNNLQQQIDTLEAASDVADVVGTKAELDSYPTENLTDRAIVEVMRDETQDDATAYYRYNLKTKSFDLVGVLGVYYTKAEADAKFATEDYVDTSISNIPIVFGNPGQDLPTQPALNSWAVVAGNNASVNESRGVAIGLRATVNDCDDSIAIGPDACIGDTDTVGVVTAQHKAAAAIGFHSRVLSDDIELTKYDPNTGFSITDSSVSGSYSRVVSFGNGNFNSRLIHVGDPYQPTDATNKNYIDTQLTPINAKLQYVPENTNQILSQIETNVEKAQSAADAKVASITAGTGISVDDSTPTAPVISTVGLATQSSVDNLTTTVNSKADQTDLDSLEATVANKADASALANYATKAELNAKADTSALDGYATKAELSAKADQTVVDAKVSSVTAGTGIAITGTATAPIISVDQSYITQQLEAINSTLATLNERVTALEENQEPVAST